MQFYYQSKADKFYTGSRNRRSALKVVAKPRKPTAASVQAKKDREDAEAQQAHDQLQLMHDYQWFLEQQDPDREEKLIDQGASLQDFCMRRGDGVYSNPMPVLIERGDNPDAWLDDDGLDEDGDIDDGYFGPAMSANTDTESDELSYSEIEISRIEEAKRIRRAKKDIQKRYGHLFNQFPEEFASGTDDDVLLGDEEVIFRISQQVYEDECKENALSALPNKEPVSIARLGLNQRESRFEQYWRYKRDRSWKAYRKSNKHRRPDCYRWRNDKQA